MWSRLPPDFECFVELQESSWQAHTRTYIPGCTTARDMVISSIEAATSGTTVGVSMTPTPRGALLAVCRPMSPGLKGYDKQCPSFRSHPSNPEPVCRFSFVRLYRCVAQKRLPLPDTLPRSLGGADLLDGDVGGQPDGEGRGQQPKGSKARREAEQVSLSGAHRAWCHGLSCPVICGSTDTT